MLNKFGNVEYDEIKVVHTLNYAEFFFSIKLHLQFKKNHLQKYLRNGYEQFRSLIAIELLSKIFLKLCTFI